MITSLSLKSDGYFECATDKYGGDFIKESANFSLWLIKLAWHAGCDFEDLADGFGKGLGTMGGDWSGIRDSSPEATERMLERAMNFVAEKMGAKA